MKKKRVTLSMKATYRGIHSVLPRIHNALRLQYALNQQRLNLLNLKHTDVAYEL